MVFKRATTESAVAKEAHDAEVAVLSIAEDLPWERAFTLLTTVVATGSSSIGEDDDSEVPMGDLFALANPVAAAVGGAVSVEDPRGKILSRTVLQERKVLTGTVQAVRERTVYTRVGDVFAILCVILTTAALAAAFMEMPRSLREGDLGY